MLHLITTVALAQEWSYGYYQNKECTKASNTITLNGAKREATGMAIGDCATSKYGSSEWSLKLESCAADADGRFTDVKEYGEKDCKNPGATRDDVTYKNNTCVKVDGSYRLLTLNGPCTTEPCFPSTATVMLKDGDAPIRVDELEEGDEIVATTEDGTLTTDTVSFLSISQPDSTAQFLVLTTANNASLTLTREHRLPVGEECCSNLKKAKDVAVGDKVFTVDVASPHGPVAVSSAVTAISKAPGQGLHSPVLTHGRFPVIDGLVTSFDSIGKVHLAQYGLGTLIKACKATGTCDTFKRHFLAGEHRHYVNPTPYA